ncbi:MAG: NYN domain-containing protein [Myxococcales bacterium]
MTKENQRRIALFLDFENLVTNTGITAASFDLQPAVDRLLEKGKVIYRRAYADWSRFREAKAHLHEMGVELIDVPPSTRTGKNGADMRLVIDALELCYAREFIDTFVIASGDSDFCPLAYKLRENDRQVIGIGVREATSRLFVRACDEFIYLKAGAGRGEEAAHRPRRGGRKADAEETEERRLARSAAAIARAVPVEEPVARGDAAVAPAPEAAPEKKGAKKQAEPKGSGRRAAAKEPAATAGATAKKPAASAGAAAKKPAASAGAAAKKPAATAGAAAKKPAASTGAAAEQAEQAEEVSKEPAKQPRGGRRRGTGEPSVPPIARDVVSSLLAHATGPLNPSLLKEAIVRKEPDFDEREHGFSTFSKMLEAMEREGLLKRQQVRGRQWYVVPAEATMAPDWPSGQVSLPLREPGSDDGEVSAEPVEPGDDEVPF